MATDQEKNVMQQKVVSQQKTKPIEATKAKTLRVKSGMDKNWNLKNQE